MTGPIQPAGLPTRKETRRLRHDLGLDELEDDVDDVLRPKVDILLREIERRITLHLERGPGRHQARRRRRFLHAVDAAVRTFVAAARGAPVTTGLRSVFVDLGRAEAPLNDGLLVVRAGFDMATSEACAVVVDASDQLSRHSAAILRSAIVTYLAWLREAAEEGYRSERRRLARDPRYLRRQLFDAILDGRRPQVVDETARAISWHVPEAVVACCVDVHADQLDEVHLDPAALRRLDSGRLTVLASAEMASVVRDQLVECPRNGPVATTWAVPLEDAPSAVGWAGRALRLVEDGLAPPGDVIGCEEYRVAIVMRSDPVILRDLRADLLAPLTELPRRDQIALTEVMLRWLPAHDEYKSVAEDLGVHPNTISNRIRRITEVFGTRITCDPGYATSVLLALTAGGPPCEFTEVPQQSLS